MQKSGTQIWNAIPVLRLLLPLIAGILAEYYLSIAPHVIFTAVFTAAISLIVYRFLPVSKKFTWRWTKGLAISIIFISTGALLSYVKNQLHRPDWIGNYYTEKALLVATVQEPLVKKAKSFKALAKADFLIINNRVQPVSGNILLYFKKDSLQPELRYGSQIIISKPLQAISNSGNPGAFNYGQYCSFNGIYYQTFLTQKDYYLISNNHSNLFTLWLINARATILSILRQNIQDEKQVSVAEALLIGYRDDLDKDLVQAYSNTGVVHIIAISGLHLGMIYGLLIVLFKSLKRKRWTKLVQPITILSVIWAFSCIAGAAPSIVRSAVMFTFIVLGESTGRRSNIYNNLAASALVILLFNPFSLWDVGFQLSYAAVLSIVLFSKHINNWFYFNNKLLKHLWGLILLTLSAQVLTLPLLLYHFHQFPTLFLFTNLFAVPFSGLILYGELLLLVVAPIPYVTLLTGHVTGWGIGVMNDFIEKVNNLPFSVWEPIQISTLQTVFLYISIAGFATWLMRKQTNGLLLGLGFTALFFLLRSIDFIERSQQQKLIVYHVPQHRAIDIINGRNYRFAGDSILREDGFLRNFHLKPSRILHRVLQTNADSNILFQNNLITSLHSNILVINRPLPKAGMHQKIKVDAIILSGNPNVYFNQLTGLFDCNQYIFDASNPLWKIRRWKKEAENLHLRLHSVPEQGAFEMKL